MGNHSQLDTPFELVKRGELRNNYVVKNPARNLTKNAAKNRLRKGDLDKTRDLVARAILESGPATAVSLAKRLSITPAGIRRHLDSLIADGILVAREPYQSNLSKVSRGRPSKVFAMTDSGREKFEHSYDDLAVSALRFISAKSGSESILEFAKLRANEFVRQNENLTNFKTNSDKTKSLAKFLSKEGYAATVHSKSIGRLHGEELCQHHCPIAHVAVEFPQLCDAETEAFSKILGTHVQRLATIARGDGVCTTFIPKTSELVRSRS